MGSKKKASIIGIVVSLIIGINLLALSRNGSPSLQNISLSLKSFLQ